MLRNILHSFILTGFGCSHCSQNNAAVLNIGITITRTDTNGIVKIASHCVILQQKKNTTYSATHAAHYYQHITHVAICCQYGYAAPVHNPFAHCAFAELDSPLLSLSHSCHQICNYSRAIRALKTPHYTYAYQPQSVRR